VTDESLPTQQRFVVFTDLDATLLDHDTYAFDAAEPALDRLRREPIPLVLCSSKTRAEIEVLRVRLSNEHPFVSENGGGVFIPRGYFPAIGEAEERGDYMVVSIGDAYTDLVAVLDRASRASGVAVRGFSAMTAEEVAAATGLPIDDARRARQREFDEPFEIPDPTRASALIAAVEREGKRWTRGGRFHHVTGANDKAVAVRLLTTLYRRHAGSVTTVGLGDAPNDAGFLNEVDIPILVASPGIGRLRSLVPRGRVTTSPGPAGWNAAILDLLGGA